MCARSLHAQRVGGSPRAVKLHAAAQGIAQIYSLLFIRSLFRQWEVAWWIFKLRAYVSDNHVLVREC